MSVYPQLSVTPPKVRHRNSLFSTTPIQVVNIKRVYANVSYELVDKVVDYSSAVGTYVAEVDGEVHHVKDVRHGRGWDVKDLTTYSTSSTTDVELIQHMLD